MICISLIHTAEKKELYPKYNKLSGDSLLAITLNGGFQMSFSVIRMVDSLSNSIRYL